MHPLTMDLDLAAQHLCEHAETLVVISRQVDQARPGTLPCEQRAHYLRVRAAPEGALRQTQRIDDVSNQHDAFGFDAVQELVELPRPRVPEPEMDIGQKECACAYPAVAHGLTARHDDARFF